MKKYTKRLDGLPIQVERIKGKGKDSKSMLASMEAATPRERLERLRQLAEEYGNADKLAEAESLIDSKGSMTDRKRFNELLELILSRAGRQVNEKHVFPLAAYGKKTKKGRTSGGKADKKNPHFKDIIKKIMQGMDDPTPAKIKSKLRVEYKDKTNTPHIIYEENGETYLVCNCFQCIDRAYNSLSFQNIGRYTKKVK
jgi:hypothetical protein